MKKFKMLGGGVMVFSLILGFTSAPTPAHAATSPSLGAADGYSVLSGAGATNGGAGTTTINKNLGVYPAASYTDGGITVFGAGASAHLGDGPGAGTAQDAQAAQLGVFNSGIDAASQPCSPGFGAMASSLNGLVLDPGVYCTAVDFTLSGTLTLNGTGSPSTDVWIFRAGRDLVGSGGVAAKVVFTGTGGNPCNVWWRLVRDATFTADNAMVGNILAANSITFGQSATLDGRAFAYTAAVTMLGNTISGPTCAAAASSSSPNNNTITVVKQMINDNGGVAAFSDFPLFVNGNPVTSGQSVLLAPGTYSVTETNLPGYTRTFTGNCDANGKINHGGVGTHNDLCTVVNDDIGPAVAIVPPLIDVVKVPNPLALPAGPGLVNYTYTAKNIGTVPMTNVTMLGDTCSPIILESGDTNNDTKLDLNETWIYRCAKTLTQTTTNIVTATGHANGLTAVDVATATVVVGLPVVPPLIHITKVPNPLTLPNGAGMVTYTKKVTNPGTVALSNVKVSDDKCSPIKFISGDTNNDAKLDPTETWIYTCQTKLTKTTTNTAIATGSANGFIATDFALATVVVAAAIPTLPNTGFMSDNNLMLWITGSISMLSAAAFLIIMARKRVS